MANAAAVRFVKSLIAAFARWKVAEETKDIYAEKLSKWRLTQDQWSRALSRIIADATDNDSLPALGVIYNYLKTSQREDRPGADGLSWITFDLNGNPYAAKMPDPSRRPEIPQEATNIRIVISAALSERIPVATRKEAQNGFAAGYGQSNGDPDKFDRLFNDLFPELREKGAA